MSKQKFIALIVAIVIIIIGGIILSARKGGEEGAPGEPMSVEELSGFLPIEFKDWQNPDEPWESPPLEKEEIPEEAIEIGVTAEGFSPSNFEAIKGEKVVLVLSGQDEWVHILKFKEESLADVGIAVGPDEVRAITFYAPSKPGEYEFFCDVPGHELRGEAGAMIVK